MKTGMKIAIGLALGGVAYATRDKWLGPLYEKLGFQTRRSASAAMTMAPQSEEESSQGAPNEESSQQDSGDSSYDKEEEQQESGGGMGGGGGGSGGGSSSGSSAGAPDASAPAAKDAVLSTGMLVRTDSPVLTPALRTAALQSLVRSTLGAQRIAPIATRMGMPTLASVSMPRPGIIAARAAFPIQTPAARPTSAFQSALASTAQRATAGITGRAPTTMPFGRTSQVVTRSAPSAAPLFATARIRQTGTTGGNIGGTGGSSPFSGALSGAAQSTNQSPLAPSSSPIRSAPIVALAPASPVIRIASPAPTPARAPAIAARAAAPIRMATPIVARPVVRTAPTPARAPAPRAASVARSVGVRR